MNFVSRPRKRGAWLNNQPQQKKGNEMAKPNYLEFDGALLVQIQAGRNAMMLLDQDASGLRGLAEPHQTMNSYGDQTPVYRVIDRRLQALRKAGKVRWDGKVWKVL